MFFNTRSVVVDLVSGSNYVQLDVPTTFLFYIAEVNQEVSLDSVEYRVTKQSGRTTEYLSEWALVAPSETTGLYSIDLLVASTDASLNDTLNIITKVVDVDGVEYFNTTNVVKPI